jgi:hypothetical protein
MVEVGVEVVVIDIIMGKMAIKVVETMVEEVEMGVVMVVAMEGVVDMAVVAGVVMKVVAAGAVMKVVVVEVVVVEVVEMVVVVGNTTTLTQIQN